MNRILLNRKTLQAADGHASSLARGLPFVEAGDPRESACIEMIVGRLVTDEARHTLEQLLAEGLSLTETEIRALIGTRPGLWSEMGDQIDPHLQKADLGSG